MRKLINKIGDKILDFIEDTFQTIIILTFCRDSKWQEREYDDR